MKLDHRDLREAIAVNGQTETWTLGGITRIVCGQEYPGGGMRTHIGR
jgi:hypothetical protein